MKNLIKFILILFLFQSCSSSDGYKENRDFRISKRVPVENKSAIILTVINAEYFMYNDKRRFDSDLNEINWCKHDENNKCKTVLYFNPYTEKKFYDLYSVYVVDPGFYYLDELKQSPSHYLRTTLTIPPAFILGAIIGSGAGNLFPTEIPNFSSNSGWNKKLNAPNFASFETNPNEIVYIGDLYFTFTKQKYWIKGKINLEVQDHYDEAVKYFRTTYPEYKNKPVIKRLAKPGVLLDNYDAGMFW